MKTYKFKVPANKANDFRKEFIHTIGMNEVQYLGKRLGNFTLITDAAVFNKVVKKIKKLIVKYTA